MCACGKPRFCHSTEYNQQRIPPKNFLFNDKIHEKSDLLSEYSCSDVMSIAGRLSWKQHIRDFRPFRIASERNTQIRASIIPHVRHRILSILMHVAWASNISNWKNGQTTNVGRGVLTEHWLFGKPGNKLGIITCQSCRSCGDTDDGETTEHFLCSCPALASLRLKT